MDAFPMGYRLLLSIPSFKVWRYIAMRKIQSLSLLLFILLTSAVCFSGCQKQSQPSSQSSASGQSAWTEGTSTDGEYITVRKKIDDDTVTSTVVGPKGVSIGIVHIQEGTYENIFVPYEGEIIRDKKSGIDWSNLEWPSDKNS